MNLKRRKKNSALICSCCDMPCAIIENGRLVWQSRHGHSSHSNALSLDDLKEIVRLLEEERAVKGKEPELADSLPLVC